MTHAMVITAVQLKVSKRPLIIGLLVMPTHNWIAHNAHSLLIIERMKHLPFEMLCHCKLSIQYSFVYTTLL